MGLEVFPEGDYYYGWFDEDLFSGNGIYWWADRQYFIGEFYEGEKIHGWMVNNERTYFGELLENKKSGNGVSFSENEIYDGGWSRGKKEGPGTLYFVNGDVFKGTWINSKRNGPGLYLKTR